MAPSVNSNIRLGTRLPFDPALPEISTMWLALNRFILLKRADASSICEGNSGNTGNCSYLSSYQSASPTWILTWAEYCRSNCVCESSYCGSECIWTPLDDAEGLLDAGVPWSRISADWQQKYDDVGFFFFKGKKKQVTQKNNENWCKSHAVLDASVFIQLHASCCWAALGSDILVCCGSVVLLKWVTHFQCKRTIPVYNHTCSYLFYSFQNKRGWQARQPDLF